MVKAFLSDRLCGGPQAAHFAAPLGQLRVED
jgi:hypothetical protein